MCHDHHQHSELFQDINRIHDARYHHCPLDDCVNIDNILVFPQHKSGSWFVLYLESLLTSICYVLPWSITIFYVKNVVRISPPLKNSWYRWYFKVKKNKWWLARNSRYSTEHEQVCVGGKAIKLSMITQFIEGQGWYFSSWLWLIS